jgi:hypothetical protein
MWMDIVYPVDLLRRLGGWNVKVDDNSLLVAAHHDAGKRFVLARINLLMGYERGHVNEIALPSFGNEFEVLSPPHPRSATDHVDHALQFPVVMGAGFGARMDRGGTCPQLIGASGGVCNSRCTCHTRRLGGIKIELVMSNYPNTAKAPVGRLLYGHFVTPSEGKLEGIWVHILRTNIAPFMRSLHFPAIALNS